MPLSRRKFLWNSSGAGVAVASGLLLPWQSIGAAPKTQSDFGDYKALVFVLFNGGIDSFNLLVPYDDGEYDQYADIRTNLKYGRDSLLELNNSHTDRRYGVPLHAPELKELFNDEDLAFLANVGPLTQHMIREEFLDEGVVKPLNLESHHDQQAQWQTADSITPVTQQTVGWLGRISDQFGATLSNGLSMNVSMSGFSLVQSSESGTTPLQPASGRGIDPFHSLSVESLDVKETANDDFRTGKFDNRYDNLLQQEYVKRFKRYVSDPFVANQEYNSGRQGFETSFGGSHFGQSMERIAEFISAAWDFGGVRRQTFYVNSGGWDDHANLHKGFNPRIADVSFVLKAFRDALVELNLHDNVVLCTASDFGRTLTSNGDGSDHGWGGNAMILGGSVNGGRVLGQYPEMNLDDKSESQLSNTDRGVFIPTTSLEEYFAELAIWFGLDVEDLESVLPNVKNFIPEDSDRPKEVGIVA